MGDMGDMGDMGSTRPSPKRVVLGRPRTALESTERTPTSRSAKRVTASAAGELAMPVRPPVAAQDDVKEGWGWKWG